MSLFGNGWMQKYSRIREICDRNTKDKKIFGVNETLLKINGQQDYQYWLWLAYEPNLNVCLLLFHLSIKRKNYLSLYAISFSKIRTKFGSK